MRPTLGAVALAPLLVLAVACSSDGNDRAGEPARTVTIAPSTPSDSATPSDPRTPADGTTACDEVVAGIDDFNAGDFEGTVQHFEAAVPLAETEAEADPGPAADDLLEAVRYYAGLAPGDYSEASLTSADFAKYKAITLGQCASDGPAPGDDGGVLA